MAGQTDDTKREGFGWGIWATGTIAAQFAADLDHVPGARRGHNRQLTFAAVFALAVHHWRIAPMMRERLTNTARASASAGACCGCSWS